ncbi:MAG: ribbon-helix-helix domain-containing protein [bacterium]|nr:ribbon-helix-helix domain-containing protein [bacterium]
MERTTQFSMRMEEMLLHQIDEEAKKRFKNRTELIKEAVLKYLQERIEKERIKKIAAELWLKGELSETQLKKALNEEEVKDLQFGKRWIEEAVNELRS